MHVDPTTLLFKELASDEKEEIYRATKELVLKGVVPHPYPKWLEKWMQVGKFDERQRLLVLSTVFPARALLSLLESERPLKENS